MIPTRTLLVLLAACGPSVSYAPFRAAPTPRVVPADAVEVFAITPPCPFVELGLVDAAQGYASTAATMAAMRARVGRHGADGLLMIDHHHRRLHRDGGVAYRAIAIVQQCN